MNVELTSIFKEAREAALNADPGSDGGTCNFDTPAFKIPRIRKSTIAQAAAAANVSVSRFHWMGGSWYWLHVPMNGQGSQRTTMMEAAQRVLDERIGEVNGSACGYYQMD